MALTPQARTVNALLEVNQNTSLADFISTARANGHSYRRISLQLRDVTEGTVDVTGETVRNWAVSLDLLEVAS